MNPETFKHPIFKQINLHLKNRNLSKNMSTTYYLKQKSVFLVGALGATPMSNAE